MTTAEAIFLTFAIGAFLVFAGTLAYCAWNNSGEQRK